MFNQYQFLIFLIKLPEKSAFKNPAKQLQVKLPQQMRPIRQQGHTSAHTTLATFFPPRITATDYPLRSAQGHRHSSISINAKPVTEQNLGSTKSIGLTFNKLNKSKRSIRLRQSKENKGSQAEIGSDSKITFKGVPPKRKRNSSKFCEGEMVRAYSQLENQRQVQLRQNGFLKTAHSLSIEDFQMLRKLGEGSFSQVFLAVQRATHALFALKVMEKEGLCELGIVQRLASELKIQQFCNHINIVKLNGVFHDSSRIYLIQEFAGCETLFSKMEEGRINAKQVQSIVRQLCSAVRFLHANSIIHRDIKPQNVLVGPGGVVKLTDFGWSVYCPDNGLRDTLCGTPLYLSPELLSSEKYDRSVDLWAIGVMTYEMLTGEMPFGIKTMQDLRNIITKDIDLSSIADPAARSFISTLLIKDPFLRKDIAEICGHQFIRKEGATQFK